VLNPIITSTDLVTGKLPRERLLLLLLLRFFDQLLDVANLLGFGERRDERLLAVAEDSACFGG
jgi:hypothetical protein